jgi:hypothetical protein
MGSMFLRRALSTGRRGSAFAGAAFLLLSACSVETSAPPGKPDAKVGAMGAARFELTPDASPHEGPNTFRVRLWDAEGAPLSGASLSARVVMPTMGHEASAGDVKDAGGGLYELPSVVLDMPGAWAVRLHLEKGSLTDEAEFDVEIP